MAQSGFLGEIRMFAGNFAPRSWAFCEGQLLPIAQNQALFSILGTIYGGDGRTTFALPDLRGRAPISPGTGPGLPTYREGQKGGQWENFISVQQMPAHNHAMVIQVSNEDGEELAANGNVLAGGTAIYNEDATANASIGGVVVGNTGSNQPVENRQPFLAIHYIIAIQGTFPSRS